MVATVYFPRNSEEFDYSKQFEPESSCEILGACKSQGSPRISNIKCLFLIYNVSLLVSLQFLDANTRYPSRHYGFFLNLAVLLILDCFRYIIELKRVSCKNP